MRECGPHRLSLIVVAAALFVCPAQAVADGLPILGVDASRTGLIDSSGSRYVTLNADGSTVVARTEVKGGEISNSRLIDGRFTIPAVAYDGSPSGLSADGRTLVLIKPRVTFPQRRTTFALIDTARLRLRDLLTLRGNYSFDAVSPDGSTLFLIQYTSPRDPTRYLVRAYDLASKRVLPEPIVDPAEPDERMAGMPVSRAASPDGRWAYTLYDGSGHEPFIHALDTVEQRAVCVDLPQLENHRNLFALTLQTEERGPELTVLQGRPGQPGSQPLLSVDTGSFAVSEPSATPPTGGGNPPWLLIGGLGAALGIGFARVAVGRRGSTEKEALEQT